MVRCISCVAPRQTTAKASASRSRIQPYVDLVFYKTTYLGQQRYADTPDVVVSPSEGVRLSDFAVVHPAGQINAGE